MTIPRFIRCVLAVLALTALAGAQASAITVGPFPASPVPDYLPPLPADTFLVPIEATGAESLQSWQFDLRFDNTVVQVVDPFDGSSGLYGATYVIGDASTQSFLLGGFVFNELGLVDDVTGAYPALLNGVSGDGVLAYLLFGFLPGQTGKDPGFQIIEPSAVPEPASVLLVAPGLLALCLQRRRRAQAPLGSESHLSVEPRRLGGYSFASETRLSMTIQLKPKTLALAFIGTLLLAAAPARAQTVANGPYYASPSWDQTLPAAQRFIVLSNMNSEAVLDRETGLVWEKTPSAEIVSWSQAVRFCLTKAAGGRYGWRLPTAHELSSLSSPPASMLPPGSPFAIADFTSYWSATSFQFDTAASGANSNVYAYAVSFYSTFGGRPVVSPDEKISGKLMWCVRGG